MRPLAAQAVARDLALGGDIDQAARRIVDALEIMP
jgi:hypothetical protein